jgi:hypothetical protein
MGSNTLTCWNQILPEWREHRQTLNRFELY